MQRGRKGGGIGQRKKEKKPKTCYAVQARVDKRGDRWTQIGRACGFDDQEQQEEKGGKQ